MQTRQGKPFTLGIVADGYGLHGLAERVARLTIETIRAVLSQADLADPLQALKTSIQAANQRVSELSAGQKQKVIATVAIALIHQGRLFIANVGNNRIYLLRQGKMQQITLEHTWALERIRHEGVDAQKALADPKAQELSRALGVDPNLDVDLGLYLQSGQENDAQAVTQQGLPLAPGDAVLICSDGMRARDPKTSRFYISLDEIKELGSRVNPMQATKAIIQLGKKRKIPEDLSLVILKATEQPLPIPSSSKKKMTLTIALLPVMLVGCLALLLGGWMVYQYRDQIPALLPISDQNLATIREGHPEWIRDGEVQGTLQAGEQVPLEDGTTLSTQEETVIILLPGGEQLYIKGTAQSPSQVELSQFSKKGENTETKLSFIAGSMFITFDPTGDNQNTSIIQTPYGQVEFSQGIMGLRLDTEHSRVMIDCVVGTCTLLDGEQHALVLESGQQSWFEANGEVHSPATFMELSAYPPYPFMPPLTTSTSVSEATHTAQITLTAPLPTSTHTFTPSPTPTSTATPQPTKKPEDIFPPGFPPPPTEPDWFP